MNWFFLTIYIIVAAGLFLIGLLYLLAMRHGGIQIPSVPPPPPPRKRDIIP